MNKSDLVRKLANDHGLPVVLVKRVVDDLFVAIQEDVLTGGVVNISGFGKFTLKFGEARRRLDPKTGRVKMFPPRIWPTFSPAMGFKQAANHKGGGESEDKS